MSWIRSPFLHFLLLGALLFCLQAWRSEYQETDSEAAAAHRIEIDAALVAELQQGFASQMGRAPAPAELDHMIAAEVDEEILYREAVARGLLERDGGVQTRLIQKMLFLEGKADLEDAGALLERAVELGLQHDDIVVRRILVQKMRLLGSILDDDERPSAAEIAARYALDQEAYREPDRISFVHVFLSADRRPKTAAQDARALRERLLHDRVEAADGIASGDPFPLGHRLEDRSERDLSRAFGERFGTAAFTLEPNEWTGPIESAYGQHLLWIDRVELGDTPPLEAVAERIRNGLEHERREARFEALLSDLRTRYEVHVERVPTEAPTSTQPQTNPQARTSTEEGREEAG